jgi:hypothetical protein
MSDRPTIPTTAGPGKREIKANAPAQRRRWPGVVGIALVVLVIISALIPERRRLATTITLVIGTIWMWP